MVNAELSWPMHSHHAPETRLRMTWRGGTGGNTSQSVAYLDKGVL